MRRECAGTPVHYEQAVRQWYDALPSDCGMMTSSACALVPWNAKAPTPVELCWIGLRLTDAEVCRGATQ